MLKDKIAIISEIKIPPKYYPLFNAKTIDMFRHEFKVLDKDEQKEAIKLYGDMLKVKRAIFVEMVGMAK